jgi:hypothetical protein
MTRTESNRWDPKQKHVRHHTCFFSSVRTATAAAAENYPNFKQVPVWLAYTNYRLQTGLSVARSLALRIKLARSKLTTAARTDPHLLN